MGYTISYLFLHFCSSRLNFKKCQQSLVSINSELKRQARKQLCLKAQPLDWCITSIAFVLLSPSMKMVLLPKSETTAFPICQGPKKNNLLPYAFCLGLMFWSTNASFWPLNSAKTAATSSTTSTTSRKYLLWVTACSLEEKTKKFTKSWLSRKAGSRTITSNLSSNSLRIHENHPWLKQFRQLLWFVDLLSF